MFAGGTEAGIAEVGIAGFSAMRALSRRNDDPQRASRPFDLERDGFVIGEAAGVVVLEELEHAARRGAKVYAELIGIGLSSDAHHMTEPDPTGEGPARALRNAMADAGITPDQVDHVNAHATSTPIGDASETRIVKQALGEEKAYRTPISAIKGHTGHCLGASGAIEAIATIFAVQRDMVPPTINLEHPDPECDLDYVAEGAREVPVEVAITHNFGFGGHNAALVFRKWREP
jgi:3-oxoacyl-[acyl-carrier-protein] synthase II